MGTDRATVSNAERKTKPRLLAALGARAPLGLLFAAACAGGPIQALHPSDSISVTLPDAVHADTVDMTYLGAEGFVIDHAGAVLLTAPFLSNPSFFGHIVLARAVHPQTRLIDSVLGEPTLAGAMSKASVILVGHSHYDHLMDVPYIAEHHATHAVIYGSPTMGHMLAGDPDLHHHAGATDPLDRVREIPVDSAATAIRPGAWYYTADSTARFMAILSDHAPNIDGIMIAKCVQSQYLPKLPEGTWQWCLGEPYAYLIDLLRPNRGVAFRIYYMDAVAAPPLGLPPQSVLADHPVDIAVLCVGNYEKVADYPQVLLAWLTPRLTILAHWEDFFHDWTSPPSVIWFTKTKPLVARVEHSLRPGAQWVTPLHLARIHIVSTPRR